MSILTIVQRAMVACGLDQPSSALANTDQTVQQFITHSLMEGESLLRDFDWKELIVQASLTGDGTSTNFDLPSDWERWAAGQVFFKENDTSEHYRRVTQEQFNYLTASDVLPTYPVWRMIGTQVQFLPALPSGDVLRCEYISTHWIMNADLDTRRLSWAADTDVSLIPERLITLGIIWRFKQARGFPFADDLAIYQAELQKVKGNEAGSENINLGEPSEWFDVFPSFKISAA